MYTGPFGYNGPAPPILDGTADDPALITTCGHV